MNSRNKGANGEREVCSLLRSDGIEAKRNLDQYSTKNLPDIIVNDFAIEVKRSERVQLKKWFEQVEMSAAGKKPTLMLRWNRGEWLVVQRYIDWLEANREELCKKTN